MKRYTDDEAIAVINRWHAGSRRRWVSSALFAVLCLSGAVLFGGTVWVWLAAVRGGLTVLAELFVYVSERILYEEHTTRTH